MVGNQLGVRMPVLESIRHATWMDEISAHDGIAGGTPIESQHDAGPWQSTLRTIVNFQHLGDDWDGFGAEPPARPVLASAIGLAYCLFDNGVAPPDRVVPGVNGTVIFEWQEANGTYTVIEVDAYLHAEVVVNEPGKPSKQWSLPTV